MISDKNKNAIILIGKAAKANIRNFEDLTPDLLAQAQAISNIIDKIRKNIL